MEIKKLVRRIYEFDFSRTEIENGYELLGDRMHNDFGRELKKVDLDVGIVVQPYGYSTGLVYRSDNGGEILNNPRWNPDLVDFSFNIYGLKQGVFYRITIVTRDSGTFNLITDNRQLIVQTSTSDLLFDEDITGVKENKEYHKLFRAESNEIDILFKIGKIYISDIIIDEVELVEDSVEVEENHDIVFASGKTQIVSYGVFGLEYVNDNVKNRYTLLTKYSGEGINLYYDKNEHDYIIEKDNTNELITDSFTNVNYTVDINTNKIINNDLFDYYRITDVNPGPSLNTLRTGYIKFAFFKGDKKLEITKSSGKVAIFINRIF